MASHLEDGMRTYIFKFKLANGVAGIARQDARSHFSAFSITWQRLAAEHGLHNINQLLCTNLQQDEQILYTS